MPPKRFGADPFGQDAPLEALDAATYGVTDLPDSGRVVAKPTSIFGWRADLRQPRRAIPANVRGEWDGGSESLPRIFAAWFALAEQQLGVSIPKDKAVRGEWQFDGETDAQEANALIDLLKLAASIYIEGLLNPMHGANGVIESGERRWLAYHLLHLYSGKDYSKIPTREKKKIDVWAQAAENGSRAPLNAVGMARQIALLIMDMYTDATEHFVGFDDMVLPGECDRKFYAQVANGNVYPIKRGMGERVLGVTGLKSAERIRNYRALLSIPDALWQKADEQNWTDWQIRDYLDTTKATNPIVTPLHSVEVSTPSDEATAPSDPLPREMGVKPQPITEGSGAGLYTGKSQPHTYEDTDEPDDDLNFDDYEDEDEPDDEPESTDALLKQWTRRGSQVDAVLNFCKMLARQSDDYTALRGRLAELSTISAADLANYQKTAVANWWIDWLNRTGELLNAMLNKEVLDALLAYMEFLQQEGERIRQKRRR